MGRNYKFTPVKTQLEVSRMTGWRLGLDTLVSSTQIKPQELAAANDIQLVEDGKIQCPRDGQAYFGSSSGSRVRGIAPFYKSDGTKKLLRTVGTHLQVFNTSTLGWDNVSGATYTNDLNTNMVTAEDRLYICNGTDNLTYYDGSSITAFTAISAPVLTSVTPTGGTGSFTYSYKLTAVTAVGETTPSAANTATSGVAVLDSSHYMTLSWSAVTNAIGYNIYGRKDGAWFFMTFLEGNASTSYIDKAQDTPSEAFPPPEGNSTGGQVGSIVTTYKDSLFIAGDPANPSRVYFSGGADHINDFTVGGGGGSIDISKDDGQIVTGLIVFKDTLLVFKSDSIYRITASTSGNIPFSVSQVHPSIGCIAPRSIVAVENDIFFAGRRGVFTIGNETGFAFDVLRTNELSARVRLIFDTVDPLYIQNITAFYSTKSSANLVIFAYTPLGSTTNSAAIVYDRERLGWVQWSNIQANCWATYRGSDGVTHYLYGDDSSGYVKEVLTGSTDFGSQIHATFRLRSEEFKELERYKKMKDFSIVLRKPTGYIQLNVIKDGVTTAYTTNAGSVSPTINFAHYVFQSFQFKTAFGTGLSGQDENLLRTKRNLNILGRSFQMEFDNNSVSKFTLLLVQMTAKPRSERYRASTDLIG